MLWVFPSAESASGHIQDPKKGWSTVTKRAGIDDLHMHDLRRTLATYQKSAGASLEIIGASLGHRSRAAMEIYARTDLEPVRRSVDAATHAILNAGDMAKALPTDEGS